jgi:DNA-binding protein H-NS
MSVLVFLGNTGLAQAQQNATDAPTDPNWPDNPQPGWLSFGYCSGKNADTNKCINDIGGVLLIALAVGITIASAALVRGLLQTFRAERAQKQSENRLEEAKVCQAQRDPNYYETVREQMKADLLDADDLVRLDKLLEPRRQCKLIKQSQTTNAQNSTQNVRFVTPHLEEETEEQQTIEARIEIEEEHPLARGFRVKYI